MISARVFIGTPSCPLMRERRTHFRSTHSVSAVASVVIHALLLLVATRFALKIESVPVPIAVTLLQVAPPPPPGPAAPVATAPTSAAVAATIPVVRPVEKQMAHELPVPIKRQRPVLNRTREQAPPKQPVPDLREAAPVDAAAVPPGTPEEGPARSGHGVAGGVPGGQPGGVVGGQGDVAFGANQVASAPVPIKKTIPEYPVAARREGIEGLVVLAAVVGRDGGIEADSIHVVQSQAVFDGAAVDALRSWRFKPGRDHGGQAVRVRVNVPLRFRLR